MFTVSKLLTLMLSLFLAAGCLDRSRPAEPDGDASGPAGGDRPGSQTVEVNFASCISETGVCTQTVEGIGEVSFIVPKGGVTPVPDIFLRMIRLDDGRIQLEITSAATIVRYVILLLPQIFLDEISAATVLAGGLTFERASGGAPQLYTAGDRLIEIGDDIGVFLDEWGSLFSMGVGDSERPYAVVTSPVWPGPTASAPIPIEISLSDPGFSLNPGDLMVRNASIVDFAGSDGQYTANLNPVTAGYVEAFVRAGVFNSPSGLSNFATCRTIEGV